MADKLWNAKYWADRLEETTEEAKPLLEKIYNVSSTQSLTIEEQFKLRSILEHYASYSRLLSYDMAQPDPKPVPFWKRLFKK